MIDSIFWRLVWKEYRVQRAFWIAMAILTVLLQLIAVTFVTQPAERVKLLFHLALAFPAFYALGCGATLFATEHETGTYEFQRGLPVSAWRIFWSKLACAATATLAMIGLFWLLALALAGWRLPEAGMHGIVWGVWGLAAVELFVWGVFFSLLLTQPLKAALLGVGTASVGVFLAVSAVSPHVGWQGYLDVLKVRIAIAAAVALVDGWLGYRWLRDRTARSLLGFRRRETAKEVAAGAEGPAGWPRRAVLGRLVWQQWRLSTRTLAIFAAMVIPLLLIGAWERSLGKWIGRIGPTEYFGSAIAVIAVMALITGPLLGACTFLGDQRRYSFRFLAERGARPRCVWLSRQLVWLPAVLLWAVVLYSAISLIEGDLDSELLGMLLGIAVLTYAAGQMFSMFLHSGILAGFLTVVATGMLLNWAGLMNFWGLSWLWSLAPIPPVLLLASWLRAPDWLLERNGVRAWLRPIGLLFGAFVGLLTAVVLVRIYSVPSVDLGFSPEEYARPATPEETATLEMYRQAVALMVPVRLSAPADSQQADEPEDGASMALSPRQIAWVEANETAIAMAVRASRREECDFFDPFRQHEGDLGSTFELGGLLVCSAWKLHSEGALDAALEQYLAALRISAHLRHRTSRPQLADWLELSVSHRLPAWAAHPEQTAERIQDASDQLDRVLADHRWRADAIRSEHLRMRQVISADRNVLASTDMTAHETLATWLWTHGLPWERIRATRMLNQITTFNLEQLRGAETSLSRGEAVVPPRDTGVRGDEEPQYALRREICFPGVNYGYGVPNLIWDLVRMETRRRAVRLVLALEAWKARHGELPQTLEELVGPYIDRVPIDPCCGSPLRYVRHGAPAPIRWSAGEDSEIRLGAGKPFVWSVGSSVRDRDPQQDDILDRYEICVDPRELHRPESEIELWQHGWVFPVP